MKKVIITLFLCILLLNVVSAERYIVEVKDGYEKTVLKDKVVKELKVPYGQQVGMAKVGSSRSKKVVIETSEEELLGNENVIGFEPDYKMQVFGEVTPWNYEMIGVYFENLNIHGDGVRIAILDTGVDYDFIDVVSGWDFVNEDSDAMDDHGHGTWVGQILKMPNTNLPLINAEVYAVKVMDSDGSGWDSDIIEGVNWAIENNIDIILMSFGGEGNSVYLREALDDAYAAGILSIASSGNFGDRRDVFPADYSSVISVGSVDDSYQRSSFSSYGDSLELMAPGESIKLYSGTSHYYGSGTSFSAPHVSIAAALTLSDNSQLSNAQLRGVLRDNAFDLGAVGRDDFYGYGLVRYVEDAGPIGNGNNSGECNNQTGSENCSCECNLSDVEARIAELETKISDLENWSESTDSWKNSINSWKTTIDSALDVLENSISDILISITGLITRIENVDTEIDSLEEDVDNLGEEIENITDAEQTTIVINATHPYFDYLSSSQRKKIVCGYAEENHLDNLIDLGWDCSLEYRMSRGKERARCRCRRVE